MTTRSPHRAKQGLRALVAALAFCVAALGLALVTAGRASAHAALMATNPAANAVVASAPRQVVLDFGEGVGLLDDSVRVFGPAGERVDDGRPLRVGGNAAEVGVLLTGALPHGTYTVAWHVISADTHPVAGAFVFSVGSASRHAAAPTAASPNASAAGILYGCGRYLDYTGYAVLVGVSAFVLLCRPGAAARRSLLPLLRVGWWSMVLATVALLTLRGPYASEQGPGRALSVSVLRGTLGTTAGIALLIRLLLLAAAYPLLRLLTRGCGPGSAGRAGRGIRRGEAGLSGATVVLAVGLASTWSLAEHASVGIEVAAAIPFDILHLVAMACWLGGLSALVTMLWRAPAEERADTRAVSRFSAVALASVAVLVLTGVYQTWRQTGSWDALVATAYGRWLLLKVYGVLVMLTAAFYSRRWAAQLRHRARSTTQRTRVPVPVPVGAVGHAGGSLRAAHGEPPPRTGGDDEVPYGEVPYDGDVYRRALRRTAAMEAAVGILVLAVTTVLTNTQPPRAEAHTEAAPRSTARTTSLAVPFDTGQLGGAGRGTVDLTLTPGRPGGNTLRAVVLGPRRTPERVPELDVALTLPSRGIGPLKAALVNSGSRWVAKGFQIPMQGAWQLSVTVRTSAVGEVTETRTVRVAAGGQ